MNFCSMESNTSGVEYQDTKESKYSYPLVAKFPQRLKLTVPMNSLSRIVISYITVEKLQQEHASQIVRELRVTYSKFESHHFVTIHLTWTKGQQQKTLYMRIHTTKHCGTSGREMLASRIQQRDFVTST